MDTKTKRPRLEAYYKSKVLNSMMTVTILSLLTAGITGSLVFPVCCASLAFALFIGYSIWFWIKKPTSVTINKWLSDINGLFTLYFLIIAALKNVSEWWYIFPVLCGIMVLFLSLTTNKDETIHLGDKQSKAL